MAASETTICNLALAKLGARTIMSLDDQSPEARSCKLHYAETRDEVLRHHRWNFAIARDDLSQLPDVPISGYSFQYQLPTDCLRMLELNGFDQQSRPGYWEVEGKRLLTNDETATIKYIRRVTDCNLFDAIFVDALAIKIAAKLCKPLTGSITMAEQFLTEYEKLTGGRARRVDAFEKNKSPRPAWVDSALVFSRFGGG
jgi:hypothetical protein